MLVPRCPLLRGFTVLHDIMWSSERRFQSRDKEYNIYDLQHAYVCWRPLPTFLFHLCALAESTWPTVGVVNRRGQQKRTIYDACGLCQMIWIILKPVFHWFRKFVVYTSRSDSYRSRDVAIFVPTTPDTGQQTYKPITLPLAHVHGVTTARSILTRWGKCRNNSLQRARACSWYIHECTCTECMDVSKVYRASSEPGIKEWNVKFWHRYLPLYR